MAVFNCALSLQDYGLSALVLKIGKKGWSVENGTSITLAESGDERLKPSLKTACKILKLSQGLTTVSLPRHRAIMRTVLLPSIEDAELKQMARFEAERHIPFNAERHCIGYHTMRTHGVEGSDVVLAAIDGPIVHDVVDAMLDTALTPHGITLSSISLLNSLRFSMDESVNTGTRAVMAIGIDCTDIILMTDGRMIYARSIPLDLRSLLESWSGYHDETGEKENRPDYQRLALAARMIDCLDLENQSGQAPPASRDLSDQTQELLKRLTRELGQTWDYARRRMNCPEVESIHVTGEGALLPNLAGYIQKETGHPRIDVFNPITGMPGTSRQKFPFEGLEFSIALGGIIGQDNEKAYHLDLTPLGYYQRIARGRMIRRFLVSSIFMIVTLCLGVVSYLHYKDINRMRLVAYQEVNKSMGGPVSSLDEKKRKIKIIRPFVSDHNSALKVLKGIVYSPLIPARVTLSTIEFNRGKNVFIEGEAKTAPDILAFKSDLISSGHFADIQMKQESSQLFNKPLYTFTFECPLSLKNAGEEP
jgi:Tfp pilus assembly PilM family ATPase